MSASPEIIKKARDMLAERQEAFRLQRAAQADKARRELPLADELANRIRRVFTDALTGVFTGGRPMEDAVQDSLALQSQLAGLLERHGFEPDILFEKPYCRECGDTGYIGSRMCRCLSALVAEAGRSQLAGHESGSFDSFDLSIFSPAPDPDWGLSQRENMEGHMLRCREWAKSFGKDSPNLFLNGGTGQGKTYLCACMAQLAAQNGAQVCYTPAIRMVEELEAHRFERGDAHGDVRPFYQAGLLIIDDLGTEMLTAFVQSALYDIINTRLISGVKTIISANLTAEQLNSRYLPQICSRLLGEYRTLHFFGPDIRMTRRNVKKFGI